MNDMPSDMVTPETIPNFLMLEQIPANYVQQLETDLLEPVVFSNGAATTDGFARFTLQNKGFLHSHSKIFVGLKPSATVTRAYLQPHVGIGQIVKKAVLKIGNKTLNELDSWAGLYAVKSSLITNENNLEREMYTTGRFLNHGFRYNDASDTLADDYGLDTGIEYDETDGDLELPDWYVMDGLKPAECPTFQIDLSDLFPFLKVNQLPLYMIKEPINIELTFQPSVERRVQTQAAQTGAQAVEIVRDDLKFCADYIFYGASDEMDRYAAANQDLSFSFVDYRLVEATTSHTALASGIVRNLGMANRIVPRVITLLPSSAQVEGTLLGENNSIAPFVTASGVQTGVKYNIRYNDRFEYTSDIDNVARLFSEFTQSEGVPFVTRQEFSSQGNLAGGITTETFMGHEQSGNLKGQLFYMGTKLTNGRVGQRGLELHLSGTFPSSGRTIDLLRVYCEYVRVARLSGGYTEIYNA
jgi:hypothetical protein